jgi:hypothetical protein
MALSELGIIGSKRNPTCENRFRSVLINLTTLFVSTSINRTMKLFYLSVLLFGFWLPAKLRAQTITLTTDSPCFNGNNALNFTFLIISNGRNIYTANDGVDDYEIAWSASGFQWEVVRDPSMMNSGPQLFWSSAKGTVSNPPNLTFGEWASAGGCGATLIDLSGPGTQSVPGTVTWTGTQWLPGGVRPDLTALPLDVVITANLNTDTSVPSVNQMYCRNLTVNPGQTLVAQGNAQLVLVSGTLNYSGATIEVRDGASFIQTATSTGNPVTNASSVFRLLRQGLGGSIGGYNYVASPVQNVAMSAITTSSIAPTVRWKFDEPGATFDDRWVSVPGTEILLPGRGYLVVTPGLLTFNGLRPFNEGGSGWASDVTITRTALPSGDGFNIIGNPFPSDLDMVKFVDANGVNGNNSITGEYWFWHETNTNGTGTVVGGAGNFLAFSGLTLPDSAYVATGQGFYVQANSLGSALVTFTNDMRTENSPNVNNNNRTDFFRTEETKERFRLRVSHTSGLRDDLLIGFASEFTDGPDRGWDASKLDGNNRLMLAAVQANKRYAIAALPKPSADFALPLTLQVGSAGDYTFMADRVTNQTEEKLFLEDRQTGKFYDLEPNRAHTLPLEAGNYRERFYLRKSGGATAAERAEGQANQPLVYASGNELTVVPATDGEQVTVLLYSQTGHLLASYEKVVKGARLKTSVPIHGVYLVKTVSATTSSQHRVWLEH